MKGEFQTNFGAVIADYWREHFPEDYQALLESRQLERRADRAADDAAALVVEAMWKHKLDWQTAYDLAAVKWQSAPLVPAWTH